MDHATESPLNSALRQFELSEANLVKLEKISSELRSIIGTGPAFGDNPDYESSCHSFNLLWDSLPKIDNWKPSITLLDYDKIGQMRLDALDINEIECTVSVEHAIEEPFRATREYRRRFSQERRKLVRESLINTIEKIDGNLQSLSKLIQGNFETGDEVKNPEFELLKENANQIQTLLGSTPLPAGWRNLRRHLSFGLYVDLHDIITYDWADIKMELGRSLYGDKEPVPVQAEDLGNLVNSKPQGPVATKLLWEKLSPDDFERLIFMLISSESDYENPEWLMSTNAPDRGRDLSAYRVYSDSLSGTIRKRVIIQCKHWQKKSVGSAEIAILREQMKLWDSPRVDVHVIATSGRFSSDAVAIIESHNQSDSALQIEMWPESHLELLLASRPHIIAGFSLR